MVTSPILGGRSAGNGENMELGIYFIGKSIVWDTRIPHWKGSPCTPKPNWTENSIYQGRSWEWKYQQMF